MKNYMKRLNPDVIPVWLSDTIENVTEFVNVPTSGK